MKISNPVVFLGRTVLDMSWIFLNHTVSKKGNMNKLKVFWCILESMFF